MLPTSAPARMESKEPPAQVTGGGPRLLGRILLVLRLCARLRAFVLLRILSSSNHLREAFSSPFYRWGNRGTEVSGLPRVTWLVSGRAGFKLRPLGLQSHLPSRVYELLVLRHAVCSRGVVPVLEAHGPCGEYGCDLSCNHGGCQEVARVCPVGFSMTETAVGIRCTGERLGRRVGGNSVSSVHPSVLPGQSPERCRPG